MSDDKLMEHLNALAMIEAKLQRKPTQKTSTSTSNMALTQTILRSEKHILLKNKKKGRNYDET